MRSRSILCILTACQIVGAGSLLAHDPGLSSANVELRGKTSSVTLTFNKRDIAGIRTPSSVGARPEPKPELAVASRAVTLEAGGRRLAPDSVTARPEGSDNIVFLLRYLIPNGTRQLQFESNLLKDLPFGHRQTFAVRDLAGKETARLLLSSKEPRAIIELSPTSSDQALGSFVSFLLLGIRHILTGYDHLLFLFGLLVACRTVRSAAILISCFTIAHSLTLALSTFGIVSLSSRYVEPAIAASIIYVGYENLIRGSGESRWRWIVTLAFGLIHGLGFASVLRELGIANSGLAAVVPLVGFNSGVEVGQLCIAIIVLPIVWSLRRRAGFIRVGVPACSVAVTAAGAYWFLERTVFS